MKKLFIQIFLILGFSLIIPVFIHQQANAASTTGFDSGRIIDDDIFYNSNSMSTSQVQTFLNSKVPVCDTQGTQSAADDGYPNLTHAQYASMEGWAGPPYTCLKDYSQTTPQMDASGSYCEALSAGTYTAAQIISNVANACGVNPQVLIVLLEKEQSLVDDNWPLASQYTHATGFTCSDSAPCNPSYNGFFYQVYYAARQYKLYQAEPSNYDYLADQTNYIYYNSSLGACGGSNVYIQNEATAGLYDYTPYQPNSAALNSLTNGNYGTGDSCSSWGNLNFWRLFTNWFGSTTVPHTNFFIPDGNYVIANKTSPSMAVDVSGGLSANGTRVDLYSSNGTGAQTWKFTQQSEGFYEIQNVSTGKYLDVTNGNTAAGTAVEIWAGNGGCAQNWALYNVGPGIELLNKCSGNALDVTGGVLARGTNLQTYTRNGTPAQLWSFKNLDSPTVADGFYQISSLGSLNVGTENNSPSTGSNIQLATADSVGLQYWKLARQADGAYKIWNPSSNRYIEIASTDAVSGASTQLGTLDNSCTEEWRITKNTNSTVTMTSACSNLVLDISGGAISTSGTNVQLYESNGTGSQQWNLNKLTFIPNGLYTISTVSGKVLDVQNAATANGSPIQLWDYNGNANQVWKITNTTNTLYTIQNVNSGKYIDVAGASSAAGSTAWIWPGNGTAAQSWNITNNSNSTFTIQASFTKQNVIDVSGGAIGVSGTRVQTWPANGTLSQAWLFDAP